MSGGAPHRDLLRAATLQWLDELAVVGVFTTDHELTIASWNRWMEQHTGKLAEQVVGRKLLETFPELVRRGVDAHYFAALSGESRVLAHSFHHYLLAGVPGSAEPAQTARLAPLLAHGSIVGTVTSIEDVSDRVASERELRYQIEVADIARLRAEDAARAKDEFLATLSHEIRTPLNAVLGWTKILLSRQVEPAMLRRALEVIDRNASAQMHLIEDMLDMARIMSGKIRLEMQPVDMATVLTAAVDVILPTATAKGLTVETQIDPGVHWVSGDPDRLQQIIWNLLSNAVKFTDSGGRIRAGVSSDPVLVRAWVSDTGRGIAENFLPHMFERFRQADVSANRRQGGLGLGLPLVKQLVELHGGTVSATSVPGAGSTFTISLPTVAQLGVDDETKTSTRVTEDLTGVRVLIVEDDPDARELTAAALTHFGATVLAASDCAGALRLLEESFDNKQPVQAIVADIGLPGQDGYYLVEQIAKLPPRRGGHVPLIALTAYGLPNERRRALAAGFRVHLVKPVSPETLGSAVRGVLTSHSG